ncbi:PQQ-dependent sugar dehydrogenase [Corallococcus silvisoli]|uniref:PQQ-dependent sugar dehydrogenase n=1 Tax=Corallococcus silvisoli TaxID=2697031 RepID=UPI001377DC01|nr:sugar dehydrogenase [Corallococcus silvisoli]NBD11280.1 sugar dehydrogenase [Corallococcus silvisoli]
MRLPFVLTTFLGLASLQSGCRSNDPLPSPPDRADAGMQVDAGGSNTDAGIPVELPLQAAFVMVPETMRSAPFDVTRSLNIPNAMRISVWARVPGARFLAVSPEGTLLVSVPSQNKVVQVRPRVNQPPEVTTWASGLGRPHDLVFHERDGQQWVFVSEKNRVTRSQWTAGETTRGAVQTVVSGLPDASLPELQGAYGHELKNIAVDSQHRLYVSIASTCNVCLSDTTSDPLRGAIYRWDWDGGSRTLFARGLRNAEGLAWVPGTDTLWVAVNNRDNTPYPFDDGSGQYGKVIPQYVDNHPPEALTSVREGGHYGWPFCNSNPDSPSGLKHMPLDRDYDLNRDGSRADCATLDRTDQGIQAHSAPLGLTFFDDARLIPEWPRGAIVAYHGSWNRTERTGYKVTVFPWDLGTNQPTGEVDLVTGFKNPDLSVWGRPVDVALDPRTRGLYISDDEAGAIYSLEPLRLP